MKRILALTTFVASLWCAAAQKSVYIPREWKSPWPADSLLYAEADPDGRYTWSRSRSRESDNVIVFWDKNYTKAPDQLSKSDFYYVDIDDLLRKCEAFFQLECSELGFVHIIGRNKLDSIWLSTGDKKDLMTICNCCPCCCLWNMTRNISDEIGSLFKRMEGVTVTLESDKCIQCGSCSEICFTKAVKIVDGKCTIDDSQCRGCGRCAERCPKDAITITYDESKVESEAERIASLFA